MTHGLFVSLSTLPPTGPAKDRASSLGRSTFSRLPELLPRELEAAVVSSLELYRVTKRKYPLVFNLGKRETRMRSADVGNGDRPHAC